MRRERERLAARLVVAQEPQDVRHEALELLGRNLHRVGGRLEERREARLRPLPVAEDARRREVDHDVGQVEERDRLHHRRVRLLLLVLLLAEEHEVGPGAAAGDGEEAGSRDGDQLERQLLLWCALFAFDFRLGRRIRIRRHNSLEPSRRLARAHDATPAVRASYVRHG